MRAREEQGCKRGGKRERVDFRQAEAVTTAPPDALLALDEAMDRLAATNRRAAELVKLRYFAGFSNADAASLMGISPRKADQVWAYARAWLREEVGDGEGA